jgi:hypothetical protein
MLCELPENVPVDLRSGFGSVNQQVDFLGSQYRRSDTYDGQRETHKK